MFLLQHQRLAVLLVLPWRAYPLLCMNLPSQLGAQIFLLVGSTGTAVHEPAVVFASPAIFAPAPHSAAAATASAVAFEIKLRNAARVGSDAACTDTRAFGTHSAHVELATPCTTTSHDTTTPGSRSPPYPSMPPPPPHAPSREEGNGVVPPTRAAPRRRAPYGSRSKEPSGPAIAAVAVATGVARVRRTAARGEATARSPEENRAATTREDNQVSPTRARPPTLRRGENIKPSLPDFKEVQPYKATPVSGRCSLLCREVNLFSRFMTTARSRRHPLSDSIGRPP